MADTEQPIPLSKVDSAVQGLSSSPPKERAGHRRMSSHAAEGVFRMEDLGMLPFSFINQSINHHTAVTIKWGEE